MKPNRSIRSINARREASKRASAKRRELVQQIKLERGCIDCGYDEHAEALAFDHRDPSTKKFTLSRVGGNGLERLMAEVEKCDVRCHNCHAVRTAIQREMGLFKKSGEDLSQL